MGPRRLRSNTESVKKGEKITQLSVLRDVNTRQIRITINTGSSMKPIMRKRCIPETAKALLGPFSF